MCEENNFKSGKYLIICPNCHRRFIEYLGKDAFDKVYLLARYTEQTIHCDECGVNIYINERTCHYLDD